jgi:hypothetical protein
MSWVLGAFLATTAVPILTGCGGGDRAKYPTTDGALKLDRVVLYRNGIGYFERLGAIDGDSLTLKIRKDQVNDLLKSLTVVERSGGKALSVSMPLDPQSWANAALSTLSPGRGSLADVLDSLRGTEVTLTMASGSVSGRIAMVERIEDEPDPSPMPRGAKSSEPPELGTDYKVTLLDGETMRVVRLSKVEAVHLEDGDLAMQFHRRLDATSGEGMFQQVTVTVRLAEHKAHEVLVSYVVSAPMWKPTYRVVLPESGKGKGEGLLQGWAVVDNTSGEDWTDVKMALTSGAPIAFRYDLHTPREVERTDLTEAGVRKRAAVAVGETTYADQDEEAPAPEEAEDDGEGYGYEFSDDPMAPGGGKADKSRATVSKSGEAVAPPKIDALDARRDALEEKRERSSRPESPPEPEPAAVDFESLRRSTLANARSTQVSGLTRFDLTTAVTVPDGTSTMVAIINHPVAAEETFLYRPGGAGIGYETNPYRVVRFKNTTPFVLEPGPITIYSGGSFVGEGLSEAVGTNTSATIPFAVEPSIMVTSTNKRDGDELRLIKIVRGVLEVESFARSTTTWSAKGRSKDGFKVLIRHAKSGWNYELRDRPDGTEDLPGAYLVPLAIPAGKVEGELTLVEQTPSRTSISIWDGRAIELLEGLLLSSDLAPGARQKLEPVVKLRQEIGRIDTQIDGLKRQQRELDERAEQTRDNLRAVEKDPQAGALRARLAKRLEEFTQEGDGLGRKVVELSSARLEKKIELEDLVQNLEMNAPPSSKSGAAPSPPTAPPVEPAKP